MVSWSYTLKKTTSTRQTFQAIRVQRAKVTATGGESNPDGNEPKMDSVLESYVCAQLGRGGQLVTTKT